jgi:hypothetical protein
MGCHGLPRDLAPAHLPLQKGAAEKSLEKQRSAAEKRHEQEVGLLACAGQLFHYTASPAAGAAPARMAPVSLQAKIAAKKTAMATGNDIDFSAPSMANLKGAQHGRVETLNISSLGLKPETLNIG